MESVNPTPVRESCKKYIELQINTVTNLWDISPAVDRSLGYIDACAQLLGLSTDDQTFLRREIQHNAVSHREHMIGVFYPPGTYRNQIIPEAGVNWWFAMSPGLREQWLTFVESNEPETAWQQREEVSAEYERLSKDSLRVANDYLSSSLPETLRYA